MSKRQETADHKDCRLTDISLEAQSFGTSSAELERERQKAIADLLYENSFELTASPATGPYRLTLAIEDSRLTFKVNCLRSAIREDIRLPLAAFKKNLDDYAILCDSFDKTARSGHIHRLEAIDAGRRSLHDEGAEMLCESLTSKVKLDKATARRLFSLLFVLYMRNITTF